MDPPRVRARSNDNQHAFFQACEFVGIDSKLQVFSEPEDSFLCFVHTLENNFRDICSNCPGLVVGKSTYIYNGYITY